MHNDNVSCKFHNKICIALHPFADMTNEASIYGAAKKKKKTQNMICEFVNTYRPEGSDRIYTNTSAQRCRKPFLCI